MNLFIFGSCVSRDAFELDDKKTFRIVEYYSRSSVASAFLDTPAEDRWSDGLQSKFQARQVHRDFTKQLTADLLAASFDILLIDFIDERFNLFEFDDGTVVTLSAELSKTDLPKVASGTVIPWHGDRKLQLWDRGWTRLMQLAEAADLVSKIRINKVFWSQSGNQQLDRDIPASNACLDWMYARCARDLSPDQFICYPPGIMVTDPDHKWGATPFHFHQTLYRDLLRQLADTAAPPGEPA